MKIKITVFIFVFLIITLVSVFKGIQESTELRSKATTFDTVSIPTVVPAPKTVLTPPYLRLVATAQPQAIGEKFIVDIYARTNTQFVIAAGIALKYDGDVVSFLDQEIVTSEQFFPITNIEEIRPGIARFSFFLSPEDGYEPITFLKEEKIGTISFIVVGNPVKETTIELLPETGIFSPRDGQTGEAKNRIVSSEGVSVLIK